MIHSLYLVISRPTGRASWKGPRIELVKKKKPKLTRPHEQALVRLLIDIPDRAMEPRQIHVEIKPEHLAPPAITVAAEAARTLP